MKNFPIIGVPIPSISFITSVAWTRPICPGTMPRTPASLQVGAALRGGGFGKRHLRQGPLSFGQKTPA